MHIKEECVELKGIYFYVFMARFSVISVRLLNIRVEGSYYLQIALDGFRVYYLFQYILYMVKYSWNIISTNKLYIDIVKYAMKNIV